MLRTVVTVCTCYVAVLQENFKHTKGRQIDFSACLTALLISGYELGPGIRSVLRIMPEGQFKEQFKTCQTMSKAELKEQMRQ